MKATRLALCAALLALPACPLYFPGSIDGLCYETADTYCRFLYQCCNASEREDLAGGLVLMILDPHTTEEECRESMRTFVCMTFQPYEESVAAGRMEFNSSKAYECLQTQKDAVGSCDAEAYYTGNDGKGCEMNDYLTGTIDDGDECYQDLECKNDDAECRPKTSSDPGKELRTSKGTCEPPPGAGEPCDEADCDEGLYCDSDQRCRARKAAGDACELDQECLSDSCAYDSGTASYACAAKKANGEDCYYSDDCDSGNCENDVCANKRGNGEDCTQASECQSGSCDYQTYTCAAADGDDKVEYDMCTGNGGFLGVRFAVEPTASPVPSL